jgi:hypothetical protein
MLKYKHLITGHYINGRDFNKITFDALNYIDSIEFNVTCLSDINKILILDLSEITVTLDIYCLPRDNHVLECDNHAFVCDCVNINNYGEIYYIDTIKFNQRALLLSNLPQNLRVRCMDITINESVEESSNYYVNSYFFEITELRVNTLSNHIAKNICAGNLSTLQKLYIHEIEYNQIEFIINCNISVTRIGTILALYYKDPQFNNLIESAWKVIHNNIITKNRKCIILMNNIKWNKEILTLYEHCIICLLKIVCENDNKKYIDCVYNTL